MKITSLSERQRRTDARQRARLTTAHASTCPEDLARRPASEPTTEAHRRDQTSAHEPRRALGAAAISPSFALQAAEDEGWPTARGI
jgi:hypothetical protein